MSAFDDEGKEKDHDSSDVPCGTDPCIRSERGREWFLHNGAWYLTGSLPEDARKAYLQEQLRRDRAERSLL